VLLELYVRSFAIIDELRVRFGPGLNVLTGETGAGKSIIVDALSAALGLRVGAEAIRSGDEQAVAEAVFQIGVDDDSGVSREVRELLAEHGLWSEDGILILSREINRSTGRTAARVNSRSVPLSLLQRIGQMLIDIHGQSEHLSLLRVREHVDYLDRYAGHMDLREQVSSLVRELRSVRGQLEQMQQDERESAREIDLLDYQIQEIRAADLSPDEEGEMLAERSRLRNAERLRVIAHEVHSLLAGADEQLGAVDLLAQADKQLAELSSFDASLDADRQAIESARFAVEEASLNVRAYVDAVEDNPARLNEVEERLELISGLKRKYGGSVSEIIKYCEDAQERLERLSNRAHYQDQLREKENSVVEGLASLAYDLSTGRKRAATQLAQEVRGELASLNMGGTSFEVAFSLARDPNGIPLRAASSEGAEAIDRVAFDSTGVDRVEFLVSPNPGEAPKPLARIASGGETARLMLALKTILSRADAIPSLVFDEIDVGVGARSGLRVGEKLWRLTEHHQVLCITHMPQIACIADTHLSVSKQVEGGRTRTSVQELEGDSRLEELATMLAGSKEVAAAVTSAQELLDRASDLKNRRRPA
jgi:DNA repair protein RecN (Recombination protein N)